MARPVTEITADIKSRIMEITKLVDELVGLEVPRPTVSTRRRVAGEIFVLLAKVRGRLLLLK